MNFGRAALALQAVERLLELVDPHAVAVHLDLHDVGLVGVERRDRARVRRRLGDDDVAGIEERLADQVDDLLAAGGDEEVVGVDVGMPSAAMTSAMHGLTASWPSVGPYCSALAVDSAATSRDDRRVATRAGTSTCREARRRAR